MRLLSKMEFWLIFPTYLYIAYTSIYTHIYIHSCVYVLISLSFFSMSNLQLFEVHYIYKYFPPMLFLFHFTGDKSPLIYGESGNQTVLFWHANSICILQITRSFCFVWSNKENSHSTSHKVCSLQPLKAVSGKELPRKAGAAYWNTQYCTQVSPLRICPISLETGWQCWCQSWAALWARLCLCSLWIL